MFDKRPKLHWKAKSILLGGPIFCIVSIIFSAWSGEGSFVSSGFAVLLISFIVDIPILSCYYRDLDAFEKRFEEEYGMSYYEYIEKRSKPESERKINANEAQELLIRESIARTERDVEEDTVVSEIVNKPEDKPASTSGYKGRPGSLSFEEVSERREKMQPVYVAARHCYGIIERDEDVITLEDGKQIKLSNAFLSGIYDQETDNVSLDIESAPEEALSYRQLIRMDRRPVYVPKFDSWGSINVEKQEIWFNKSVVPCTYGKTNRIGLYEASKLGVYEEDVTK